MQQWWWNSLIITYWEQIRYKQTSRFAESAQHEDNNKNDLNESKWTLISSRGTQMIAQLETQSYDQGPTGLMRDLNMDESATTFGARGIFETDAVARAEVLALIPRDEPNPGRSGLQGSDKRSTQSTQPIRKTQK